LHDKEGTEIKYRNNHKKNANEEQKLQDVQKEGRILDFMN